MSLGRKLALGVGLAALGGAVALVATHGEKIGVLILVLIGGSALSGFLKAKPSQP